MSLDIHSSVIELSKSAYLKNVRFLKKTIGPATKISSVIKGNAYGHGIKTFVPMAEECGIDHFSVFSPTEAEKVIQCRTKNSQIMVMGDVNDEVIPWLIENDISFYVFNVALLRKTIQIAEKLDKVAMVHLELETGMNRLGIRQDFLSEVIFLLKNTNNVVLEGLCTHLAGAESISNYVRISSQQEKFHQICNHFKTAGLEPKFKHIASSSAALVYPNTRLDLVRLGIVQYGFWPTEEIRMQYFLENFKDKKRMVDPLKRVLTWKSRILNIKEVNPGEFVGYGTAYLTTKKQKIAAIPVGYYHGFSRNLSNLGRVLVRGKRAAVAGTVNMNMILINVTDVKDVCVGDEVVLIGKQKKLHISVASFSDMTNYLNYEILTRLPEEIPRIVVE